LGNDGIARPGTVPRMLLPTDGLWRGARHAFTGPTALTEFGPTLDGFPFRLGPGRRVLPAQGPATHLPRARLAGSIDETTVTHEEEWRTNSELELSMVDSSSASDTSKPPSMKATIAATRPEVVGDGMNRRAPEAWPVTLW
jgi:hypothetical protein